ncbi:cardiolipin synthase [Rothia sp. ZJ1223]|uniref:cardiolipin synthase n=1 Tax=Rothia sp. ZJ1223 TaxID=2811098 RepID=UPI0019562FA8|nr:cardiolipin synthase [Rothia sp. ZJ1223]MBM7052155.1 cardiolipin synthase [Rothia sp. ZJ1223]
MNSLPLPTFSIPGLPPWVSLSLVFLDLFIRLITIFWLPYNRKPIVALGWLMAIFLIPYVGFLGFLVFGSSHLPRYRRMRQSIMNDVMRDALPEDSPVVGSNIQLSEVARVAANLNYRLGSLPMVSGNSFTLHRDNHEAMLLLADEIDKAQTYVHFEFYIASLDEATRPLWESLVRAHQRGVRVHVLIDHIGSRRYKGYWALKKLLNESGISWHLMLPLQPHKGQWQRPDLRNHRKIVVIDGRLAFSGSQNAIHRAYNVARNDARGMHWLDLSFTARGPVVEELNAAFVSDWYSETKELLIEEIDPSLSTAHGGALAQVVPSGPGFETENNLRLINHLIYNAERRILICSPYFVPEETLLQALTNAALSNIDVTVIVTEKGDQFLANMGQRSYYEQLLRAGIKIQAYPGPTVLHAKFMLIDDEMALIGSSNMDPRSFSLNLEISTFIVDGAVVDAVEEVANDYLTCTKEIRYNEWIMRPHRLKMIENVCRLTSSLL